MTHTINVSDLADQDAVHQAILDIQNHGVSYSLVRDGVEVAKVIPTEKRYGKNDKVSEEVTKRRWAALARAEELSKRITEHWSTDETALEAIQNDRR